MWLSHSRSQPLPPNPSCQRRASLVARGGHHGRVGNANPTSGTAGLPCTTHLAVGGLGIPGPGHAPLVAIHRIVLPPRIASRERGLGPAVGEVNLAPGVVAKGGLADRVRERHPVAKLVEALHRPPASTAIVQDLGTNDCKSSSCHFVRGKLRRPSWMVSSSARCPGAGVTCRKVILLSVISEKYKRGRIHGSPPGRGTSPSRLSQGQPGAARVLHHAACTPPPSRYHCSAALAAPVWHERGQDGSRRVKAGRGPANGLSHGPATTRREASRAPCSGRRSLNHAPGG